MAFLAPIFAFSFSLIAAIVPAFGLPGSVHDDAPPFPAPPGYVLPWIGGTTHTVTQGEETSLTHNGLSAYAFDFDLNYDIVVAARGGQVVMVRQDSTSGGCGAAYVGDANYVVIDHGDGTSALYLHLAPAAVLVTPGQIVERGQAIAVSGETGLTCSDDLKEPAPHLHFQVERTDPGHYFTQSLPIAFDDIAGGGGVPREGASYVSDNVIHGRPLIFALTPHHDPRPFHPVATPADPSLTEGDRNATPTPAGAPAPQTGDSAVPTDAVTPTPEPSMTPRPTRTPTPRPTYTPTPTAAASTTPTPTDTPAPTNTPAATDTPALPDTPTATPTLTATSTATSPAATSTP